jgi:hypothetical protein
MDFAYAQERLKKPDIPWATFVDLIPKVPTGGMRPDSCPFEIGIYEGDEDDDNNYWEYPGSSAPFKSAMNAIIGDTGSFTNWHFGWTGMTPAVVDMGTERSCGNTPNLVPPLCDPLSNPQCAMEWGKYAWTAGKFAFCWL